MILIYDFKLLKIFKNFVSFENNNFIIIYKKGIFLLNIKLKNNL